MPQNRGGVMPARAYGAGFVSIWGGFLPYGSTAGGSEPIIPNVVVDGTYGKQIKWKGFTVAHDNAEVGRYQIMLDSDTFDLLPVPTVQVDRKWRPATVFFPSTTAGDGLQITAVQAGPSNLATIPILNIVSATSGAGTTASVAISGNTLTITAGASATNATVAAAINAYVATGGVTATVVAGATDVFYTTALTLQLSGGENSDDLNYASVMLPSTTAGYGILYTANSPGAWGNDLNIVYVAGGGGTAAVAAIVGNQITITVDTSTTNEAILTAVNETAAATVGKVVTASLVAGSAKPTHTAVAAAMVDVYAASTSYNTSPGTWLTTGGLHIAKIDGRINPKALVNSGIISYDQLSAAQKLALPATQPYSHFAIKVYAGDTPVDLSARSQLFVPSETQGSGVMYNSVATLATNASATLTFNAGPAAVQTLTALQPGDLGNSISITYETAQATLFLQSATVGSGLTFTATSSYTGPAGQLITVAMAAPNPNSSNTLVTVNALAISIFPKANETNTGVAAAVAANPAALQLVGTPAVAGGSDLVIGNSGAAPLGGGYVPPGSASAVAAVTGSPTTGWTITVQFGASCTSTTAVAAINAVAGPSSPQPILQTVTTTNGGSIVNALGTVFLTGGFDPSDLQVQYAPAYGNNLTGVAVQAVLDGSGNLATLTVASTANFPAAGTIDVLSSTGVVQTLAYTGKTATTFTTLTGGTANAVLLAGAIVQADAVVAVLTGDLVTVYLGYTAANNTNTAIANAVNEVAAGLLTAVPVNVATDLNEIDPNGLLAWGATGQVPQQNLECLNIVRFIADAIDSAANGAL